MPDYVIVEDTSLDIEGEDVGINVKWALNDLHQYIGKKATHITLLATRIGPEVLVFEGKVEGTIVEPKGNLGKGFGFDNIFPQTD